MRIPDGYRNTALYSDDHYPTVIDSAYAHDSLEVKEVLLESVVEDPVDVEPAPVKPKKVKKKVVPPARKPE